MASHMVSAYAYTMPSGITIHSSTSEWTENGVTGKIYPSPNNPNYQTFYASTTADRRYGYIYAEIFLEDAETNANIATKKAYGSNLDSVDVYANVTYGYNTYVRVTGIHKVGSSESNITTAFGTRNIYKL